MENQTKGNKAIVKTLHLNIKNVIAFLLIALISQVIFQNQVLAQNLKVSDNNRFLVNEDKTVLALNLKLNIN